MRILILILGLFSLGPTASAEENILRLYLYAAPQPLQWDSPGALARSLLKNSLTPMLIPNPDSPLPMIHLHPNPLSHVDVELICNGERLFLTGMSRTQGPDFFRLPFEGIESFLQDQPGKLLTAEEIENWWRLLSARNEVNAVSFDITAYACGRARKFLKNYRNNQPILYGGIASDPLKGSRAAGCAAFAYAFLEIALGPHIQIFQNWRRQLNLHTTWLDSKNENRPRLWELLLWDPLNWPEKSRATRTIEFFDPQLAFEDVRNWVHQTGDIRSGSLIGNRGFLDQIPHIHFKKP